MARYNVGMHWIYLSPHFDDVALSCGGLVWEQVQGGDSVSIWTICAADPPLGNLSSFAQELHSRWQTGQDATSQRKNEDLNSCHRLGASHRYFSIPDCIYRRNPQTGEFLYASEAALNGPLQPEDTPTIMTLRGEIKRSSPAHAILVSPLGLGSHVDHQLTHLAVEGLDCTLWYYADFPYVLRHMRQLEYMSQEEWVSQVFPVSQEGLAAWQDSIATHASQISTFWMNEQEMRLAVGDYFVENNGIKLWRKLA
jgi:LmbE family N-acetylglucosaminyl deacetylase